jgi:hypothetical protein
MMFKGPEFKLNRIQKYGSLIEETTVSWKRV